MARYNLYIYLDDDGSELECEYQINEKMRRKLLTQLNNINTKEFISIFDSSTKKLIGLRKNKINSYVIEKKRSEKNV